MQDPFFKALTQELGDSFASSNDSAESDTLERLTSSLQYSFVIDNEELYAQVTKGIERKL